MTTSNPRDAVAASDDHQSIGLLGQAWCWLERKTANAVMASAAAATTALALNPVAMGSALLNTIGGLFGYKPGDLQNSAAGSITTGAAGIVHCVNLLDVGPARTLGNALTLRRKA